MLHGEVDLILPTQEEAGKQKKIRLLPEQFVYYPAFFPHSLENVSSFPSNYLMFKWYSNSFEIEDASSFFHIKDLDPFIEAEISKPFATKLNFFNGSTCYCKKLHSHTTYLLPHGGYKKHKDLHDVAIVMLDGEAISNDMPVKPFDVIYFPAGEWHDMYNHSQKLARYLVFEFHGNHVKK